jgi:hypothetical protein
MWGPLSAGMDVRTVRKIAFSQVSPDLIACTIGSIAFNLVQEMPPLVCKMNAGIHVYNLIKAAFSIWIGHSARIISGSVWVHATTWSPWEGPLAAGLTARKLKTTAYSLLIVLPASIRSGDAYPIATARRCRGKNKLVWKTAIKSLLIANTIWLHRFAYNTKCNAILNAIVGVKILQKYQAKFSESHVNKDVLQLITKGNIKRKIITNTLNALNMLAEKINFEPFYSINW